jgi:hypothetical protein
MLPLIAPILLALLLIAAGLWLTWRRGREQPMARPMACVACGMPAGSLTSFICPGCNTDIRLLGVAPPPARGTGRLHPVLKVATWSVLIAGAALLGMSATAFEQGGRLLRHSQSLSAPSDSTGLRSAEITADIVKPLEGPPTGTGTITITTGALIATLEVDLDRQRAGIVKDDGSVLPEMPLSPAVYDDLFRAAGLDPADAQVRDGLEAVRAAFEPLITTGEAGTSTTAAPSGRAVFNSTSGGTSSSPVATPGAARWIFAGMSAVWLAGVAWLLRRRADARPSRGAAADAPVAAQRGAA